jgi:hypothetical protein
LWQNRLNYTGSNTQVLSQGLQRTSNGVTHWSVGSPPDTTMIQQDRCRFTSHEGEFTITAQLITFNLQIHKHYYKPGSTANKIYTNGVQTDKLDSLSMFTAKRKVFATTHVAKADTMLSPGPGVTPEGHCRPGTGPTPWTSQKEQTLATQGCPWDSRRLYLQMILARLSILILSKA